MEQDNKNNNSKRISVEVSHGLMQKIKQSALDRNITVKRLIIGIVLEHLAKEDTFK